MRKQRIQSVWILRNSLICLIRNIQGDVINLVGFRWNDKFQELMPITKDKIV